MSWAERASKVKVGDKVTALVEMPQARQCPDDFWETVCIPITKGLHALVDAEDYERVCKRKWHAHIVGPNQYARSTITTNGKRLNTPMQRLIINTVDGFMIDHRNGNGLDNRKRNLRIVTKKENNINIRARVGCASKYKGVIFERRRNAWLARIQKDGKSHHLGQFRTEHEAAMVYNLAAVQLFGEFARLNDIDPKILTKYLSRVTERGVLDL